KESLEVETVVTRRLRPRRLLPIVPKSYKLHHQLREYHNNHRHHHHHHCRKEGRRTRVATQHKTQTLLKWEKQDIPNGTLSATKRISGISNSSNSFSPPSPVHFDKFFNPLTFSCNIYAQKWNFDKFSKKVYLSLKTKAK
ncbi:unnamed protein product, partial [Onchocerca flexuosa]|uniref:Ovule protein n=1 Tax=Onchocerca flexuosa TaxID=387005 RepID=A0A183HFT4_9BILA